MTVILVHLGYVMTARSTTESAFSFSPFSNKWLLGHRLYYYCGFADSLFTRTKQRL